MKRILVLGGYGNFGKRIVEDLSNMPSVEILIGGRNPGKANALIQTLQSGSQAKLAACAIDIFCDDFTGQLKSLSVFLVIHTSGPFQGQDHRVPKACIEAGAHYIDLADDSRFVCEIPQLDTKAKSAEVLVVSGASSVPGLSSAVIDHFQPRFSQIDTIDIAIAPGNKAERGEATVRGILSYTGHPFDAYYAGKMQSVYGWMDQRKVDFGDIAGKRWLANVDVPDLTLFPKRYNVTEQVRFQAGLELPFLHLSMVAMAHLVKSRLIKNWSPLTKPILGASNLLKIFGSDIGAMQVQVQGKNHNGQNAQTTWTLYAPNGIGPYIPTLSSIIVARKLIEQGANAKGATPCVGQFTLDEFMPYFEKHGIYCKEQHNG